MTVGVKNKLYSFRAADVNGKIISGSTIAIDKTALYHKLQEQNYFLISSRAKFNLVLKWRSQITTQELLDFCLHMQYMDQAGVPLLDALKDAKGASEKLKPVMDDMIAHIKGGKMLSETMATYPHIFPELFCQIIYLSEQSGQLADGFKKLYEHLSWQDQNKRQLTKSFQYPALVFALICVVIWMMSSIVVPQMHELIKISGTEVPYSSRLLLSINQSLMEWAPRFIILTASALLFLLGLRLLSSQHRNWQDLYILKIPLIGGLLQKLDLAMYLHFFHVCLSSHVDLLESLEYSKKAVKNSWLQERLNTCAKLVRDGTPLSKAMGDVGIFDASTIRMLQVGEVTGQLIALLAVLETYQLRDLKRQMEKFITYLQPILLGVIGLLFIWIVLGIFYPMYDQLLVIEG